MTPDERVLVLMPTAKDSQRSAVVLNGAGIDATICANLDELCREIGAGAGAALLTEEALAGDRACALAAALASQPAWSDFPLVLLARDGSGRPEAYRESMNVTLVERPVRVRSLLSVVRAALRARRHQYRVRDHLAERDRQADALRDREERLEFALTAGRLGSWDLDLANGHLVCSEAGCRNFGLAPPGPHRLDDLLATIHPDDCDRVQAALGRSIQYRADYDVEYRARWPDGSLRWVLVRGRATHGPDSTPLRMAGVNLDITDRRRDEEALRDADRKKDDFLALLAHELRNPLAPIRNGLHVLRLSDDRGARQRAQNMMERQLGHMVRLIDDLLDVSRINRNKMELRVGRILLADVVSSAVETARPLIEAGGHELDVWLPPEPVELDADLTRLAQVFANLLTNSAKYTAPGGRIQLVAVRDGDRVVVSVRDTGIGIPLEAQSTIFDMFSQVDRSIERVAGGLGIGLALVRGLVEMHGGTVSVESAGEGCGSTFTVRLPAVPLRATLQRPPPPAPEVQAQGLRVLVVDDNRDAAESLAEMLRLFGNEVAVAHDGAEGVDRAEAFRPEVILMDLGMPRLSGLDATRRIRERPWGRDVSIIALTGWGQDGDRVRSREAGCDGHLVKPASIDDLMRVMTETRDTSP